MSFHLISFARWQQAIAANPQGFQNLHPQIQAKILAKIQAAKQRQAAAAAAAAQAAAAAASQIPFASSTMQTAGGGGTVASANNNADSMTSSSSPQFPANAKYFYSQTLNQIFHIQNNVVNAQKSNFSAMRYLIESNT